MKRSRFTIRGANLSRVGLKASVGIILFSSIAGCSTPSKSVLSKRPINVTVSDDSLSHVRSYAIGMNVAAWDGALSAHQSVKRLNALQPILRFPGGSFADRYHWQSNSVRPGSGTAYVSYKEFSSLTNELTAPALITLNYGSNSQGTAGGTPQSAAKLLSYLKRHVKTPLMVEIGNETYGSWETNLYPLPHSAKEYAQNAKSFVSELRQVDSGVPIGVPFANSDQSKAVNWNKTVMQELGSQVQFVDVHWYPFSGAKTPSNAELMQSIQRISAVSKHIQDVIHRYNPNLTFVVGETGIASDAGQGPSISPIDAPYAAADILSWLENGASRVLWWDWHNDGTSHGDYGAVSSGTNGEPTVDQPFPSYWGLWMAHEFVGTGGELLKVGNSSVPRQYYVFAIKGMDGTVRILVASDQKTSARVSVKLSPGIPRGDKAVGYLYDSLTPSGPKSMQTAVIRGSHVAFDVPAGPVVAFVSIR